jgi:hypothetical protein
MLTASVLNWEGQSTGSLLPALHCYGLERAEEASARGASRRNKAELGILAAGIGSFVTGGALAAVLGTGYVGSKLCLYQKDMAQLGSVAGRDRRLFFAGQETSEDFSKKESDLRRRTVKESVSAASDMIGFAGVPVQSAGLAAKATGNLVRAAQVNRVARVVNVADWLADGTNAAVLLEEGDLLGTGATAASRGISHYFYRKFQREMGK